MDYQLWMDYHLLWCAFHRLLLPSSSLIQAIWHPPKPDWNPYSYSNHLQQPGKKMTQDNWRDPRLLLTSALCDRGASENQHKSDVTALHRKSSIFVGSSGATWWTGHTHTHLPRPPDAFSFNAWWTTSLPVSRLAVCSCLHNLIKTFLLVIPV